MVKRRTARAAVGRADDSEAQRVLAEIQSAWTEEPHPGPIDPHCQRPDCPAIAAYFSSQTWPTVRFDEMRQSTGASWDGPWLFLPPKAVCYFLPAFLSMYLTERHACLDVLADAIPLSVCPHDGWRAEQRTALESLSLAQKGAVLSFLRFAAQRRPDLLSSGIAFWEREIARKIG